MDQLADRIVMLDHLTRGRTVLGVGPGSLPTDSMMIGLNPTETRELLEVNLDIVLRLLRGETASAETRTHTLIDAQLQLRSHPGGDARTSQRERVNDDTMLGQSRRRSESRSATSRAEGLDPRMRTPQASSDQSDGHDDHAFFRSPVASSRSSGDRSAVTEALDPELERD